MERRLPFAQGTPCFWMIWNLRLVSSMQMGDTRNVFIEQHGITVQQCLRPIKTAEERAGEILTSKRGRCREGPRLVRDILEYSRLNTTCAAVIAARMMAETAKTYSTLCWFSML